ncbi:cytochrome P450 [Nocardia wallacei]|uniref:cytochrome P450 n=1 Tax=Nocardia wallacei TaxID=480035 RepID=UPI002456DC1A|nr:cytochrome P450 [Nocardia wallacei]
MSTLTLDLADPEYRLNPWPKYEKLRERPVHCLPEATWDGRDLYVCARYPEVNEALRNKELYSSQIYREGMLNVPMLVNRDAPEHTRLRRMANKAFSARLVRTLGDWVQDIVDDLLADILTRDRVEFVEAFTTALPLRVVGGMLGIPLDRKAELRRWSQGVMDGFAVAAGMDPDLAPGYYEDVLEFSNYMDELAQDRMGAPNQGDILGELVAQEETGEMTRDELVTMAWSFIAAGHETTMNLLGGGFKAVLDDPDLGDRLAAQPEDIREFIEEFLRLYSPTQWLLRRAARDLRVGEVDIPEGGLIHVVIGSANRDESRFPDATRLDLDRSNKRDHLAFGAGPHFCPGSSLSRLLAEHAFRSLFAVRHRFALDSQDPPRLRTRQGSFGYAYLPVAVEREAADGVA